MQRSKRIWRVWAGILVGTLTAFAAPEPAWSQTKKKPDFRPHADVLKGYKKVVSTADGKRSMYTIYTRTKDGQMMAELPASFSSKKYFIAMTVASGDRFAGLQSGDMYVYWKRYDKRLALITPNVSTKSTGDAESRASVKNLFTDRVLLDVPIVTIGPGGGPVIDMDALLIGKSSTFFGFRVRVNRSLARLITIKKAKAFENNVELAFEVPTSNGRLQTLHYSISVIKGSKGYKPRKADQRIGYFTTSHVDLGKYTDDETRVRYINRWHLEKADKKLTLSPAKKPIIFYIEHTTPIRYRRWVRKGILSWNKAFEKIGISDAIEVQYQDARLGNKGHMDKDPEDVNYNFVRWLNNDIGIAIGPSRVNPITGEILDADIILSDGWIRHYKQQFSKMLPKVAMESFGPETLAWLATHPDWDPRIRMAPPSQRENIKQQLARQRMRPFGGHAFSRVDPSLIGDDEYDGLIGRTSQVNGMCLAAEELAFEMALMRMHLELAESLYADDKDEKDKKKKKEDKEKDDGKDADKKKDDKAKDKDKDKDDKKKEKDKSKDDKDKDEKKDDKKKDGKKKTETKKPKKKAVNLIDGMPEAFVGPLLAHLVSHEVGHTLGLRHNFKGSSIYTLDEINSAKLKGKTTFGGSVMDYNPININMKSGKIQGDWTMLEIGPYDEWAIEYGYTLKTNLKPILDRVAEPQLVFATDEDTVGPDPLARRNDFSKQPLDYARNQLRLAKHHRKHIVDTFVKKGKSWAEARKGYELTLRLHVRAVSMMANWIGGVHIYRDKKGDKNERVPIQVVPAAKQREALKFVIENSFRDNAYGLTNELINRMSQDKWLDGDDFWLAFEDATWPVHDRIMGIQSAVLTMVMNPAILRRVFDNEYRVPAGEDALTLPELLTSLTTEIWQELDKAPDKQFTARVPMITSLRRNLQREHMKRLIDLSMPGAGSGTAFKPISNLAIVELRKIRDKAEKTIKEGGAKLDPYTAAHLREVSEQIKRSLDAQYIYNANDIGGGGGSIFFFFGKDKKKDAERLAE